VPGARLDESRGARRYVMRERHDPECKGNHTMTMTGTMAEPADGIWHHEDFAPGQILSFGARTVTRDDIIAFATAFDPQPIHLDEAAAKASIVGGLCASGFHTCSVMMRLLCDGFLLRSTSLGSPGLDEVKWLKPMRPGDTVSVRVHTLETRNLQSRPDVGISKMRFDLVNQHDEVILEAMTNQMMRRRHPGAAVTAVPKPKTAPVPVATLWDEAATKDVSALGNYFEDIQVGEVRELGSHTFGRDEIIAFAKEFDPQPFHLSEDAGRQSLFGGLSASGWHTASIFIRQVVRSRQVHEAALQAAGKPIAVWGPSPGFRNLAWSKPVLMGDRISFRNKVIETRELKSRPERGFVITQAEGRNQNGAIVFRFTAQMFVERRARGAGTA
jgi:acyl dehydratase